MGFLSFRYGLRGPYFSLVTLAFAEMLRVVAVNWKAVGSSLGLVIPSRGSAPGMFLFESKLGYYYVMLAMTLGALGITWGIARSRLGYALVAVRENEDAAEAAGLDTLGVKLSGMAVSSFLTALGGTFYAQYWAYIDPSLTLGVSVSIEGLLRAIVGGAGTVWGPLLGSFVLTPVSELTRAVLRGRPGADVMLYGLVLILVISFLPQGLMGWLGRAAARGNDAMTTAPLLEVKGLSRRFGGILAVNDLDLSVASGEIVGLIGPNGAGKTTAFHLIAGFHAPTAGAIRFKGESVVGLKPHAICRRGLARTFQIVQPFAGLSALDNVTIGALHRAASLARGARAGGGDRRLRRARSQARRARAEPHPARSQAARGGARAGHGARAAAPRRGHVRSQPDGDRGDHRVDPADPRARREPPDHRARHAGDHGALAPARRAAPRREDRRWGRRPRSLAIGA